jgi:ribosomal protein S18 acetylase RimI-like enzyme
MIEDCAAYLYEQRLRAVTLTVTQQNAGAVRLYDRLGFARLHSFDAMLWVRPPLSLAQMMEYGETG